MSDDGYTFSNLAPTPELSLAGIRAAMEKVKAMPPVVVLIELPSAYHQKLKAIAPATLVPLSVFAGVTIGIRIEELPGLPERYGRATYSDGTVKMIDLEGGDEP